MYNWILSHRDHIFILFGLSMVLVPLLLGFLAGHVPKDFLFKVGIPFILLTFSMAMGVFFLKKVLAPLPMLGVSIVFGLTWAGIGFQALLHRNENWMGTDTAMPPAIRGLGWLFCLFGALWIGIALGNYFEWKFLAGA